MDDDKKISEQEVKEARREAYERKRQEILKNCEGCRMQSAERCTSCTFGKRLRWLEAEYADVTGWSHGKW